MSEPQQRSPIPYADGRTPVPERLLRTTPALLMLGVYILLCSISLGLLRAERGLPDLHFDGNLSESIFGAGHYDWLRYIEVGLIGWAGSFAVRVALSARSHMLMVLAALLAAITAGLIPYLLLAGFSWLVS